MTFDPTALDAAEVLSTLGSVAETVVRRPRSTIQPVRDGSVGRRALTVLRGLTHDPRAYVDEAPLGQGAMGVVTRARQVALDRSVAVKTLKAGSSDAHVEALLAEAWLAGSLEHPGILPIYALALDANGRPQLVMKHIEGVTWAALLANDDERKAFAPGKSRLESHLRIAAQLCNAVHFANSRGVVHRDLKPENVMLGRFGEVYLVDWGIATHEGPSDQFAGTPAYMAPEMLGGAGATLSAQTDVYLLGSVLFEIVTGRPPHLRENPQDIVASVIASSPKVPPDVPDELARLIRACMAADPRDRPTSALDVRVALEAFFEHEGSRELAAQSAERAAQLETLLEASSPDPVQVTRLFSECRFGFQQALRSWPQNEVAAQRLRRLVDRMVRFELRRGALASARALVDEFAIDDGALLAAVVEAERVERARAEEVERLTRVAQSIDPLRGLARRTVLGLVLGALWVVGPLSQFFAEPTGLWSNDLLAAIPVALLSIIAVVFVMRLPRFDERTVLNQQIGRLLLFGMGFQVVAPLLLVLGLGVDVRDRGTALLLGYWGLVAGFTASGVLPQVWPSVAGYFVTAALAWRWPAFRHLFGSLGNLVLVLNLASLFARQRRELAARQQQPSAKA